MRRFWSRCKRAGALALATVMLACVVAIPAHAVSDPTYLSDWKAVWDGSDQLSDQREGYLSMMQKYPNGTDAYYWYVASYYYNWWNGEEEYQPEKFPELINYLNKLISLDDITDNPYAAQWNSDSDDLYLDPDGYTEDYTLRAVSLKSDFEMWTKDHQEQVIAAEQEYLDHWDRDVRAEVTNSKQTLKEQKQKYLDWGYSKAEATKYAQEYLAERQEILNTTIPNYRKELDEIRYWNSQSPNSFEVGQYTDTDGTGTLTVEGGLWDTELNLSTDTGSIRIKTSKQIRAIQRKLDSMTIFVPKGTVVSTTNTAGKYYGEGFMIWEEDYTAKTGPGYIADSYGRYNGDNYKIFVVGI